jgi:carbonic anhydrase/acetyltransferase-like protein (isoleucine patch superfamily)
MKQRIAGHMPEFDEKYYIHSTACVIGDVHCKKNLSVWPNAVIRGDNNRVEIGECVNIQDNAVVHPTSEYGVRIGNFVTVGHHAILHACEVHEGTLIGMGAIVMDGATIGKNCIIGAGTLIPPDRIIDDRSVVAGNPCQVIRKISDEELKDNLDTAERYWKLALEYIRSADIY